MARTVLAFIILSLGLTISALAGESDCSRYSRDKVFRAILWHESGCNPKVSRGAAGEWGLGQIKCQTAREVGFKGKCSTLQSARTNVKYAYLYYKKGLKKAHGNVNAAISLYNLGVHSKFRGCTKYCQRVKAGM